MAAVVFGYQVSREKRAVERKASLHFQSLAGPKHMSSPRPSEYQ